MEKQLIIRIDPELKNMVDSLARAEGKTISSVVRELLEEYVRNRDIASYVDKLWLRIGKKMVEKGFSPDSIDEIIKNTRTAK